jgi:transposase
MRGADSFTESLFTMRRLDDFVPKSHPLRSIRQIANEALVKMDRLCAAMYEADVKGGRSSIAPEKLLRAMLLQVLYSIRSERQLMEQTHFSVDGTLIQAWAGHKSFVRKGTIKDDDLDGNFRGETRSNETHASRTDPDSRLYRKGKTGSELRYICHTLSNNRHGLLVSAKVTCADGYAEREAAKAMLEDARQALDPEIEMTVGSDKGYDAKEFVDACTAMQVVPHVAQNTSGRRSAVRADCRFRRLCHLATQTQAERAGLGLGQDRWPDSPDDGARIGQSGPVLRVEHGGLQPGAHADLGSNPSSGVGMRRLRPEKAPVQA